MASLDARVIDRGRRRELAQGVGDECQRLGSRPLGRDRQQAVEGLRRDREHVVLIPDRERDAVPAEAQIAALQHATVVVGEHRKEHDVAKPRLRRVPIDVEVRRVAARGAVLEHVPPPGIVGAADGHVIGNDVEHLSEPDAAQRFGEPRVSRRPAELAVHRARIDDVVAVRAALRGLQVRGAVEVADAEGGQIVRDRRGRGEVEAGVELDAIGGAELSRHVSAERRPTRLGGETVPCEKPSPAPEVRTIRVDATRRLRYLPVGRRGPRPEGRPYSRPC